MWNMESAPVHFCQDHLHVAENQVSDPDHDGVTQLLRMKNGTWNVQVYKVLRVQGATLRENMMST